VGMIVGIVIVPFGGVRVVTAKNYYQESRR
jgi:hypothetical protein